MGEKTFTYDPNLRNDIGWQKRPDGNIVVGPEAVKAAAAQASAFGRKDVRTVIGLSVEYAEQHFPQALRDIDRAA